MRLFTLVVICGLGIMLGVGIYAGHAFMENSQSAKQKKLAQHADFARHADNQVMHRLRGALPTTRHNPADYTPTPHHDIPTLPTIVNAPGMSHAQAAYATTPAPMASAPHVFGQPMNHHPAAMPAALPPHAYAAPLPHPVHTQAAPVLNLPQHVTMAPAIGSNSIYRVPVMNSVDGTRIKTVVNR